MQPLEEEPSRLGGLHVQSSCCRRTLGQVKEQTEGTEGGEKGRDKFTEAAAVWGWLCNWPRGCDLEGAWLFLKWEIWRGDSRVKRQYRDTQGSKEVAENRWT